MLSTLATAGTTALQQLPTILEEFQKLFQTNDTGSIASLLGISEDQVTKAIATIQSSPDKVAALAEVLGLGTTGTTGATVVPVESAGTAAGASAAGAAGGGGEGHTNLAPRAGVSEEPSQGQGPGVAAGPGGGEAPAPAAPAPQEAAPVPATDPGSVILDVDFFRGMGFDTGDSKSVIEA